MNPYPVAYCTGTLPLNWLQDPEEHARRAGILTDQPHGAWLYDLAVRVARREPDANEELLRGWQSELYLDFPPHRQYYRSLACSLYYEPGLNLLRGMARRYPIVGLERDILHGAWIVTEKYNKQFPKLRSFLPYFAVMLRNAVLRTLWNNQRAILQLETYARSCEKPETGDVDRPARDRELSDRYIEFLSKLTPTMRPIAARVLGLRDSTASELARELRIDERTVYKRQRLVLDQAQQDPSLRAFLTEEELQGRSLFDLAPPSPKAVHLLLLLLAYAFNKLSDREQAALHLVEVEGRRYREVAGVLDIPLGNLKMVIFRAKRKISKTLAASLPRNSRTTRTETDEYWSQGRTTTLQAVAPEGVDLPA